MREILIIGNRQVTQLRNQECFREGISALLMISMKEAIVISCVWSIELTLQPRVLSSLKGASRLSTGVRTNGHWRQISVKRATAHG